VCHERGVLVHHVSHEASLSVVNGPSPDQVLAFWAYGDLEEIPMSLDEAGVFVVPDVSKTLA